MDAAQMLTAHEIARQCEQLARTVERERSVDPTSRRHLSVADPTGAPAQPVAEPDAPKVELAAEDLAEELEIEASDGPLSDRERVILAFEQQWWKQSGAKEQAIRELFDMSASRYYQVLNALAYKSEAVRVDPMLIKRLRKVRASRQRARAARRLGIELH